MPAFLAILLTGAEPNSSVAKYILACFWFNPNCFKAFSVSILAYFYYTVDDFDNYNFDRGNVVLNNDAAAGAHLIATMDDAAGTDCTMVEWAIGSNADQDGNWRMGIAESNLVVQVRVSGVWTNATAFQRP